MIYTDPLHANSEAPALCAIPAAALNLVSSVPASGSVNSNLIHGNGFKAAAFGVTSSQAGTAKIQRYLDAAGTVPQGAAISVSLTAATAAAVNVNDGNPWQTLMVTVTNSGASSANLTNTQLLLSSF